MAGTPATTLLGVTTLLYLVVLSLLGGRIYKRARQRRYRWDDCSIVLSTLLALFAWTLVITAITHGLGQQDGPSLRDKIRIHHLLFASDLIWIPATAFARIGIAFTILHFKQGRPWRILLSLLIAAQVLFCIINVVFLVVQCIPMEYVWNESKNRDAMCTARTSVLATQYVHGAVGTATDFALAVTPLSFVQRKATPNREAIVLLLLVLLGLFATACSILRIAALKPHAHADEDAVLLTLWATLEVQVALAAANLAAFKAPPLPPAPPTHHYSAQRRRRRRPKSSRRTSSLTRTDSYQLPELHLSLTPSHKHSLGLDTNVSSLNGSSTLRRTRSEEVIWPREGNGERSNGERHDSPFHQMIAAGGILMTTELDVRSEVMSRAGSSEVDGARENIRREEWSVDMEHESVRGDWGAV